MKTQLEKLSDHDRALLLKAPALVSVLAAGAHGEITASQKAHALELSHLRTFTAPPVLQPYYKEVEKVFKPELERLIQQYFPIDSQKRTALRHEFRKVYAVLPHLDEYFRYHLVKSLKSYARHVLDDHQHFFEFFAFPLAIPGITQDQWRVPGA